MRPPPESRFRNWAPLLLLLLLSDCAPVLAGLACFPACVIACCECAGGPAAFAGPLGIAVGLTGCTGICMVACATLVWVPPACFANDTSIAVFTDDGTVLDKPISAVNIDDEVLTLVDGQPSRTRVVQNVHSTGSFDFFLFNVTSADVTTTLKVTPQHGLLLVNKEDETGFSLPADVSIGNNMRLRDGTTGKVSGINQFIGSERYTLVTTVGTVLASGVLVSTICDEEVHTGLNMDGVMDDWRLRHQYHLRERYATPARQ